MSVEGETVRTVEVPTRMVHGPGAISRLGEIVEELGMRRPLLVTDGGVVAAGLAEKALEGLTDVSVFDGVRPNPDVELIGRTSEVYREEGCDGLVALGRLDDDRLVVEVGRHLGEAVPDHGGVALGPGSCVDHGGAASHTWTAAGRTRRRLGRMPGNLGWLIDN